MLSHLVIGDTLPSNTNQAHNLVQPWINLMPNHLEQNLGMQK